MTRAEFMEILQRSLSGSLGSSAVNGHMRYYQEYFDTQMSLGKSESEIAGELGNPRLLAKTIIEAAKREGRGESISEYDEIYENNEKERRDPRVKQYRMPGWLWAILIVVVVVALVGIVNSVIIAMFPVLFPVLCAILLVRLFRRR